MKKKGQKLEIVAIDDLVTLRRNPQYLTPHEMDALKASIQRDGFLAPVLVRPHLDKLEIVSGNHRVAAARELGLRHVPAVIVKLSDKEARRIAVNLNTVHGNPPAELLAPFLAEFSLEELKCIHLDSETLRSVAEFDQRLKTNLDALAVPKELDHASDDANIATCKCPTCGRKHFRAKQK